MIFLYILFYFAVKYALFFGILIILSKAIQKGANEKINKIKKDLKGA